METSNCAAPSPMDSPAPLPCGAPDSGPASGCPRPPAACAPATPRPSPPVPRRVAGLGIPASCSRGESSASRAGLQPTLRHARPQNRAGSPRPGPTTAAPGRTLGPRTPRLPVAATGGNGPPAGRPRMGGRCLPGSGPAELPRHPRAAIRPGAARGRRRRLMLRARAPAHPPPPRCASCGQISSLRSWRGGARASERGGGRGAGTDPARSRGGWRGCRSGSWRAPGEGGRRAGAWRGKCGTRCPERWRLGREAGRGRCGGLRGRRRERTRQAFMFKSIR